MNEIAKLTFVRDLRDSFETRREHARSAIAGTERRIARGVYMDRRDWEMLDSTARYVARVRAVALTRKDAPVVSHWSAAAIHGLPRMGPWPDEVHFTHYRPGGRRRAGVVWHSRRFDPDDVIEIDGLLVTSVARTVIDIATVSTMAEATAVADRALLVGRFGRPPLATRDDLWEQFERDLPFRGHARARDAISFAETGAESAIESLSRVTMRTIGVPRPRLQVEHRDDQGLIGATDFTWDEFGVVAEADGDMKYTRAEFRGGRSAEQVFLDEKIREDRLRAVNRGFARWRWRVAGDANALRQRLTAVGLPTGIAW